MPTQDSHITIPSDPELHNKLVATNVKSQSHLLIIGYPSILEPGKTIENICQQSVDFLRSHPEVITQGSCFGIVDPNHFKSLKNSGVKRDFIFLLYAPLSWEYDTNLESRLHFFGVCQFSSVYNQKLKKLLSKAYLSFCKSPTTTLLSTFPAEELGQPSDNSPKQSLPNLSIEPIDDDYKEKKYRHEFHSSTTPPLPHDPDTNFQSQLAQSINTSQNDLSPHIKEQQELQQALEASKLDISPEDAQLLAAIEASKTSADQPDPELLAAIEASKNELAPNHVSEELDPELLAAIEASKTDLTESLHRYSEDEILQKTLQESLKTAPDIVMTEDELLAKVVQESLQTAEPDADLAQATWISQFSNPSSGDKNIRKT